MIGDAIGLVRGNTVESAGVSRRATHPLSGQTLSEIRMVLLTMSAVYVQMSYTVHNGYQGRRRLRPVSDRPTHVLYRPLAAIRLAQLTSNLCTLSLEPTVNGFIGFDIGTCEGRTRCGYIHVSTSSRRSGTFTTIPASIPRLLRLSSLLKDILQFL